MFAGFTDFDSRPLASVIHRDDIPAIPARRGRQPVALVGGAGSAPEGSVSSTGLRGPWETSPGPTTWVRPKGLVERTNAGRNPCGMIVIGGGHCPFQKAVPRSKENASGAPRGAPVRVMGRQFPPAGGTGLAAGRANGSAFRPANFGAPLPSLGIAKGSKPTIWHDSPPGCAARQRSRTVQ